MHLDTNDCYDGENLVNVQEGLVESVAHYRSCLNHDDAERDSAKHAVGKKWTVVKPICNAFGTLGIMFVDCPRDGVYDCLRCYHPPNPSVEQVIGIEADPKQGYEWTVPAGKDDQRKHVDHCQMTCSAT